MTRTGSALFFLSLLTSNAHAQSLVPGPDDPGYEPAVEDWADDLYRVQHEILSHPLGWGLEAFISDPGDRAVIEAFVASGDRDFVASTGLHPYEVVDDYGESGDLGMFGGVQAAGAAWRYVVLRDGGAAPALLDEARADLVRVLEGLHVYTAITGTAGVVARGVRRRTSLPGEPPMPGTIEETLPLFDAAGDPQPADKTPTWRQDVSGDYPDLIWLDDTSKDQFDGYILALGAAYDAALADPDIDPALVDRLVADAQAIARSLMVRRDVGATRQADLVLMDADGRATSFHDLSAEEVTAGIVVPRATNGFNALMALGALRTLFHITGDPELGQFYYQGLLGDRGYLQSIDDSIALMYQAEHTNFSNVNMAFVAAWGVLRYETDPSVRTELLRILQEDLYAPDRPRAAHGLALPFFDFLYAGFRISGTHDAAGAMAFSEGMTTLRGYFPAPYWDLERINCDDAELAAHRCIAIDGTTVITVADALGWNDRPVSITPLPMALRPPSNFEHRSDPHRVNGGGTTRLNPGASVFAAYWMGRLLDAAGGDANLTAHPRAALPWMRTMRDAGMPIDAGPDAGGGPGMSGCGCDATRCPTVPWALLVLVLGLVMRRRLA